MLTYADVCMQVMSEPFALLPHAFWTHIAAAYDSAGGSRLYVNGSLVDYRAARGAGEPLALLPHAVC